MTERRLALAVVAVVAVCVAVAAWLVPRGIAERARARPATGEDTSRRSPEAAPVPAAGPGLSVERDSVVLRVVGDAYHADIPFSYVNARSAPVVVPACHVPPPPTVQWWTGTEWKSAYSAVSAACLTEPLVIRPGVRHRDTVRLRLSRGPRDGQGRLVEPHWRAPADASVFRLLWGVYERRAADTLSPAGGPLLPEAERASGPFRMRTDGTPGT